jgi:Co/Zn/Cd efflux system component
VNRAAAWNAARAAARTVVRSRCVRWAIGLSVLYAAMDLVFSLEMGARGLLSPGGSIHVDAVVVGLACIATRVVGRFAVPALLGFGLAGVVLEQLVSRVLERRRVRELV